MNGEYVKEKLRKGNFQLTDIAENLNISPQSLQSKLNAKDLKVSFLFALAKAINKNVYYFFGDEFDNAGLGKIKTFNTDNNNTKSTEIVTQEKGNKKGNIIETKPKVHKMSSMEFDLPINIVEETAENKFHDVKHSPEGKFPKRKGDGLIPYYNVDFAAGGNIMMFDDNSVSPAYYMDIPEFYGCKAFRAYSDSMEKLIKSGSILFGTKELSWLEHLEYGQIYGIICTDGRRYLKYIRRADNHKEHLLLRSENKDYDDFEIPKIAIRSIWLIHGWLHRRT